MAKNDNSKSVKLEFRGVFGVDGVSSGDTYPYWEVDVDTYNKLQNILHGKKNPNIELLPNGKVQLYLNQLVDYSKDGVKQKVKIIIE
jgi:hypothetical protein